MEGGLVIFYFPVEPSVVEVLMEVLMMKKDV